ncbi:alanine racemase [Acidovorax sp. SDU_ACID1]|uniref:alanine racemase n=1 Tax=Acidovorax sp. SDU_ACID1 TaxID=3136632 RepID=UPI003872E5FE
MPRPIQAVIHHAALRHNLQVVRQHAGCARVWAVVKANAYGHGIERVYAELRAADGFALLDLQEAVRLRRLGWLGPILLLEGVFDPEDLDICSRFNLWHVVHCAEQIDMLASHQTYVPHHVFLKLNSGMNRLGLKPRHFRDAWNRLTNLPQVREISMMTHFSDADGKPGIQKQLVEFRCATEGLRGERSVCNSAATLRFGENAGTAQDWVRAGVALYGGSPDFPDRSIGHWGLEPAMSLRTRIIAVQHLQSGDTVGYGSSFTAKAPMTIGIAACGYADGYPRACQTGTPVLVDGIASRTIGRVSMDMIAVDLSASVNIGRPAKHGSEVVLWGRASAEFGGTVLAIDQVAAHARTIGYELMCAVAKRVPFKFEVD